MAQNVRLLNGVRNGTPFKLKRAPLCEELAVPFRTRVWHLWLEGEYRGNFPTKREAYSFIDAEQVSA